MSKIRGIPVAIALLAFLAMASPAGAQGLRGLQRDQANEKFSITPPPMPSCSRRTTSKPSWWIAAFRPRTPPQA